MTDLIGTVWSCLDGVAEVSPSSAEPSRAQFLAGSRLVSCGVLT